MKNNAEFKLHKYALPKKKDDLEMKPSNQGEIVNDLLKIESLNFNIIKSTPSHSKAIEEIEKETTKSEKPFDVKTFLNTKNNLETPVNHNNPQNSTAIFTKINVNNTQRELKVDQNRRKNDSHGNATKRTKILIENRISERSPQHISRIKIKSDFSMSPMKVASPEKSGLVKTFNVRNLTK